MNDVTELQRLQSPAPRPQSLAFDGRRLWMGSIATGRIYGIDLSTWIVEEEIIAPGLPWGLGSVNGELRVVYGEGENNEDDRFIRRYVRGQGFKEKIHCPDGTGSQLGCDGQHLHLSQWYNQRILRLDDNGTILAEFKIPHQICGQVIVDGNFYLVTTDDENSTDYWLTRHNPITGSSEDLARIPFHARALTFDGQNFWTNHREQNEIVCFAAPWQ
jgi:hypothetical protein